MAATIGDKVLITTADGKYEGVVHSNEPSNGRLSLSKIVKVSGHDPGVRRGLQIFYTDELEELKVLEAAEKEESDDEHGGQSVVYKKRTPRHLEKIQPLDPQQLLLNGNLQSNSTHISPQRLRKSVKFQPLQDGLLQEASNSSWHPMDYYVIDQIDGNFNAVISHIASEHIIGVAIEGVKPGRSGTLCWLQIRTKSHILLFDILTLGNDCFINGLGAILEKPSIQKVIHDCRLMSDLLFHQYGVKLVNVFDTQVAGVLIYKLQHRDFPRYVSGLPAALLDHLNLQQDQINFQKVREYYMQQDQSVWSQRPCPEKLLETAAKDVLYLRELRVAMMEGLMQEFVAGVDTFLETVRDADDDTATKAASTAHLLPELFVSSLRRLQKRTRRTRVYDENGYMENNEGVVNPNIRFAKDSLWHGNADSTGGSSTQQAQRKDLAVPASQVPPGTFAVKGSRETNTVKSTSQTGTGMSVKTMKLNERQILPPQNQKDGLKNTSLNQSPNIQGNQSSSLNMLGYQSQSMDMQGNSDRSQNMLDNQIRSASMQDCRSPSTLNMQDNDNNLSPEILGKLNRSPDAQATSTRLPGNQSAASRSHVPRELDRASDFDMHPDPPTVQRQIAQNGIGNGSLLHALLNSKPISLNESSTSHLLPHVSNLSLEEMSNQRSNTAGIERGYDSYPVENMSCVPTHLNQNSPRAQDDLDRRNFQLQHPQNIKSVSTQLLTTASPPKLSANHGRDTNQSLPNMKLASKQLLSPVSPPRVQESLSITPAGKMQNNLPKKTLAQSSTQIVGQSQGISMTPAGTMENNIPKKILEQTSQHRSIMGVGDETAVPPDGWMGNYSSSDEVGWTDSEDNFDRIPSQKRLRPEDEVSNPGSSSPAVNAKENKYDHVSSLINTNRYTEVIVNQDSLKQSPSLPIEGDQDFEKQPNNRCVLAKNANGIPRNAGFGIGRGRPMNDV